MGFFVGKLALGQIFFFQEFQLFLSVKFGQSFILIYHLSPVLYVISFHSVVKEDI